MPSPIPSFFPETDGVAMILFLYVCLCVSHLLGPCVVTEYEHPEIAGTFKPRMCEGVVPQAGFASIVSSRVMSSSLVSFLFWSSCFTLHSLQARGAAPFGREAKRESVCLVVNPQEGQEATSRLTAGQRVWIGWPHASEAEVVRVLEAGKPFLLGVAFL